MRNQQFQQQFKTVIALFFLAITIPSCQSQVEEKAIVKESKPVDNRIEVFMNQNPDDGKTSVSKGLVSGGSLENGKLLPFAGDNFHYFDTTSYLYGRAFVHSKVKAILLDSYKALNLTVPNHEFVVMETSNKCGGKLDPHRTHQNGLSVDFMVPLIKNGVEYTELDNLGGSHYLMEFDDSGRYKEDTTVHINFEIIAQHILEVNKQAKNNGFKIEKVILKLDLKDELFSCKYGEELKKSGIYFAQNLTPIVNSVHDDHYHIDFGYVK